MWHNKCLKHGYFVKILGGSMRYITKILVLTITAVCITSSAWAFSTWSWDLGSIGLKYTNALGSGTVLTFDELANVSNAGNSFPSKSFITTDLGIDGVLSDDDTFSEFGAINILGQDSEATFFNLTDASGAAARIYYRFTDLQGSISNVVPNAFGFADFDISFVPHQGTIELLATKDLVTLAPFASLATFSLLAADATGFTLKTGAENNGAFSFTLGMTTVRNDFWYQDGMKAEDILAWGPNSIIALADLNARVLGIVLSEEGLLNITAENSGTIRHQTVVPEPGTMILLGAGLLGLAAATRRRN